MDTVILKRVAMDRQGTFGVLISGGAPFALTLERPWLDNARDVSCIPEGRYACVKVDSPGFGETFEVTDVPERTSILFHAGNTVEDSQGCILVGRRFGTLGGRPAVLSSRQAMGDLMGRLRGVEGFGLVIKNCFKGGAGMKKWWTSKTLWLNAIAIAAIVLQGVTGSEMLDAQAQAVVLGVVNFVLRLVTSESVGW
jgi:hypothetical protein